MKETLKFIIVGIATLIITGSALAADYVVDNKGMHAFVQFRVKHLGFSWLYGRFNNFSGNFSFDQENLAANTISVEIDTTSLDSNNAERDKHLRSEDFLDAETFPTATFESSSYTATGDNMAELTGNLTLHGVTKEITINIEHIGGGDDPWGEFRHGFEGRASIQPEDFGIDIVGKLGPSTKTVELLLSIEGIRQ